MLQIYAGMNDDMLKVKRGKGIS